MLKFIITKTSDHVRIGSPSQPSKSVKLVALAQSNPAHDALTRDNARALWPGNVEGFMELDFLEPKAVEVLRAGTIVNITIEVPG